MTVIHWIEWSCFVAVVILTGYCMFCAAFGIAVLINKFVIVPIWKLWRDRPVLELPDIYESMARTTQVMEDAERDMRSAVSIKDRGRGKR